MEVQALEERIKKGIRDIPDFPKKGIVFKDITSLFLDPQLCRSIGQRFIEEARKVNPDVIAAVDSRGFLFGPIIAQALNIPLVLIRKKGKLPGPTVASTYDLEYGSATIEMHSNDIPAGSRVLIHDDLLATGGTTLAAAELVNECKSEIVGFSFLIHLEFLEGRKKLLGVTEEVYSMVSF